jgi:hypothetical protein
MSRRASATTGDERISQDIPDISDADQLLRYALAGQLERLRQHRPDLSQAKLAVAARLGNTTRTAAPVLSHALRHGPNAEQLLKLDEIIGALDSDVADTGGLSSLRLRLSAEGSSKIMTAHVPPSWTARILKDHHPCSELDVLAQAAALLSAFMGADRVDSRSVESVRERYSQELELLVRRLILISVSPPTSRNYDAQIMLGGLASYAFEPMKDWLDTAVRYSPLAFRVWRAITKLVKLRGNGEHAGELTQWVQQLIGDSSELRARSLYPGRSLDLELALVVPAAWSPPHNDWVGDALRARAWDKNATIRERGTAAMGLWQRAMAQERGLTAMAQELRTLIAEFRNPESRPDAAAGLRWVAATLEQVIDKQEAVCNEWPDVDEPWFRHVHQVADELGRFLIPDHLRAGTRSLFLHMLLQNSGVHRRQAIETIVTSGLTNPVARALGSLLRAEHDEAWLRIRAEFALGFLQRANRWVEDDLTRACVDAYQNLGLAKLPDDQSLPRSRVTEVHTSLFAVGDCFGVAGAEDRARSAREGLLEVLTDLANAEGRRAWDLRRAARAAAYLLTVTAQPREGGKADVSEELLEKMSGHPDKVTARLSRWALSFRFAPDGTVRHLLDAAEHEVVEDGPF